MNKWDEKFFEAHTVSCLNFNMLQGNTLKEKTNDIYIQILELTNIIIKKCLGIGGVDFDHFWIITSPILAEFLKLSGYFKESNEYFPIDKNLVEIGILNKKYRLHVAKDFPEDKMLIGVGDWETCPGNCLSSLRITHLV